MGNELAKLSAPGGSLVGIEAADVFQLGTVLYESKYFKDVGSAAQAIVKILRGQELGIGPIAAMENVYVIEGKTALSYSLIGAQIKRSGRYDYRVIESTDDRCEIAFFEQGKEMGRASFSLADAKAAGLEDKKIWKQYRSTMLFARAMSQGARRYTPDVFGGAIYTPEELRDIKEPEVAIDTTVERNGQQINRATGEIADAAPSKKAKLRQDKEAGYTLMWERYHDILDIPPLNPEWTDEELDGTGSHWKRAIQDYAKQVPADAVPVGT